MSNVLRIENDKTIIAASKMVWSEGTAPHRVVLRKDGEEYITHMENLRLVDGIFKHDGFYWGHYFMLDEAGAKEDFKARVSKL